MHDQEVAAAPLDEGREPAVDEAAEARSAVTLGICVSATRCLLQYVVAPAVGALGLLLGPVGLVLQVLGAVTAVAGACRLHRLRHRARHAYAVLAVLVLAVTAWALLDAAGLLS